MGVPGKGLSLVFVCAVLLLQVSHKKEMDGKGYITHGEAAFTILSTFCVKKSECRKCKPL